ncbi:MAG: Calx-beta domain-containing protein, partial [Planctomycetota bacterium]
MVHRRASIRPRPQERRFSLEPLERRDCPAVVSIAGPTELHENGAPVTLIATLSEPQSRPVTVHYTTTGSAKAGADYGLSIRAQRLRAPSGTFVFPAGVTSLPITLTPRNDALREGTETIGFNLAFARGHTLGSNMAAVALIDDDSYTASIVGPARVEAGVTTTYRLQLSSPATKREVFYLSTDSLTASSQPTADDPTADYFPLTNVPVVIQAGETSRAFLVRTIASAANEPDQDFLIRTTPVSSGFGAVDPFGVTIIGNAPSPLPAVSVSDVTITEGNSGSTVAAFTISLSSPSGQPVTVTYATADGTATAASGDYEPKTGQVTIAPGATATTVAVNVRGDTTPEPDETFSLAISSPSNATLANASGTATIRNDDTTPATSFNIVVTFPDSSLTQSQRRVFTQATARWSQIIIGDLPDVTYGGRLI